MISASLLWVLVGGALEPTWVITMKKLDQAETRRWMWLVLTIFFMYLSPACVGMAMKDMSVGVAYAIWTGLGSVFTMIVGYLLFKERVERIKIFLVMLIIIGVVGLEISSGVVI